MNSNKKQNVLLCSSNEELWRMCLGYFSKEIYELKIMTENDYLSLTDLFEYEYLILDYSLISENHEQLNTKKTKARLAIVLELDYSDEAIEKCVSCNVDTLIFSGSLKNFSALSFLTREEKKERYCNYSYSDPGVLIVDDEKIVGLDIQRHLKNAKIEVTEIVNTIQEASKKVFSTKPSLLICDFITYGYKEDIESLKTIKSMMNIPILIYTSYADQETLVNLANLSIDGILVKPEKSKNINAMIDFISLKRYGITLKD